MSDNGPDEVRGKKTSFGLACSLCLRETNFPLAAGWVGPAPDQESVELILSAAQSPSLEDPGCAQAMVTAVS